MNHLVECFSYSFRRTRVFQQYTFFNLPSYSICHFNTICSERITELQTKIADTHSFIHSFHWHVHNSMTPGRSQELLPFPSVIYFFLPPFPTKLFIHPLSPILPSISWSTSQSCCSQIHIVHIVSKNLCCTDF